MLYFLMAKSAKTLSIINKLFIIYNTLFGVENCIEIGLDFDERQSLKTDSSYIMYDK